MKLVIVDYGSGNLRSVEHALKTAAHDAGLPHQTLVSSEPDMVASADYLVLPGVGAFADCKKNLTRIDGMVDALTHITIDHGRPFLGICVGMQLLAEYGDEGGTTIDGLGWVSGGITRMSPVMDGHPLKVPHMGWNHLIISEDFSDDVIFAGLDNDSRAYFLHSYHLTGGNDKQIVARTDYGGHIVAAVKRDNITGLQFHPEKSQKVGQRILSNWLSYTP